MRNGWFWYYLQLERENVQIAMIPQAIISTLRSGVSCWRHRSVLVTALRLQALDFRSVCSRSTSAPGTVRSMEDILTRVVVPLPTYETREKSPPAPESNSVEFMHFYRSLEKEEKSQLLATLSHDFGVDHKGVSELAGKLLDTQLRDLATILQVEDRLRYSLTPRYKQLLNHISRVEGGVKFLVDLRADLLEIISSKGSDSPHIRVKPLFTIFYGGLLMSIPVARFGNN